MTSIVVDDHQVALLTATFGPALANQLLDDDQRTTALSDIKLKIAELTNYGYGISLWVVEYLHDSAFTDTIIKALGDTPGAKELAQQITEKLRYFFATRTLPGPFGDAHLGRADGRGCICGWDGNDLLAHFIAARRDTEIRQTANDPITEETRDYLRARLNDPTWAAAYQHALAAQNVEPPFPLAADSDDWQHPPGNALIDWARAKGYTDDEAAAALGLPAEVYRGVVAGSERITDTIARHLEDSGLFAKNVWLMLERNYRAALVRRAYEGHH